MRRPLYLFLTVYLACLCVSQNAQAQIASIDSSSQQNALNNAVGLYNAAIGNQAPIYTGAEYYFYDPHIKGNAYFLENNGFTPGNIYYDRALYKNVSMLYDLNLDQVVVLLPKHISKFSLVKERVKNFDYLGHHFININTDTLSPNTPLKSGFYDQLYNGKTQILVKRSKSIQTSAGGSTIETFFTSSKDYYIKKDNVYYSIGSSQGSILNILKDKKKELRQYIRANDIAYRDNPEEAMVKIATYYDHLTN
ncbi:hypothetical protein [Mucilaginibacter sp.]|uniref:hypothetical protein n=1 Tax=Mucilaginibacter sp. TaxID=1882438 RepID=UPI003D0C5019